MSLDLEGGSLPGSGQEDNNQLEERMQLDPGQGVNNQLEEQPQLDQGQGGSGLEEPDPEIIMELARDKVEAQEDRTD